MLNNCARKVYIINNLKSDKIEQAIFILKNGHEFSGRENSELATEAQKIINDYVNKIEKRKENYYKKDNKRKMSFFTVFTFLTAIGLLSYFLLSNIMK